MPETATLTPPAPPPPAPVSTPGPPADVKEPLYEVVDGRIVEKPWMGAFEGVAAARLTRFLYAPGGLDQRGILVPEVLFVIDAARNLKRRPDLAFVSFDRWPRDRPVPAEAAWDVIPDLAVEVVSRSNSAFEVVEKVGAYFRAGVRLVWVVYPLHRLFYVYSAANAAKILKDGDDLDGGPVLDGFRAGIADVFGPAPDPPYEPAPEPA